MQKVEKNYKKLHQKLEKLFGPVSGTTKAYLSTQVSQAQLVSNSRSPTSLFRATVKPKSKGRRATTGENLYENNFKQ